MKVTESGKLKHDNFKWKTICEGYLRNRESMQKCVRDWAKQWNGN